MTVAAPPRGGKRTRWIVAAGVGVAVAVAALVLGLAARWIGPAAEANRRVQCANNMKNFASIAQERLIRRAGPQSRIHEPGSGTDAGLLDVTVLGLDEVKVSALLCPEDHEGRRSASLEFRFAYLVRDLSRCPLPDPKRGRAPLFACLRHPGHAVVAFDDSSVEFLDRTALGLAPESPIESGPDSKSELLRVFPPRTR